MAGRAELLRCGFSPHRLRSWNRSGRLVTSFRGVYSYGRDIQTRNAALRAALVLAGPDSVVTGRVALEKWGAIKARWEIPRFVEVATQSARTGLHRGLSPALRSTRVQVVQRLLEPGDVRRRDGVELLRAPLALIDFAANAAGNDVRFAFLELCRLGLFDRREVEFCIRRATGKRGVSKLRPLLGLWVPELERVRSVLEGLFLMAWAERKLAMPEVNVKVFGWEVDCLWRAERVALELDGGAFHSDPIARKRDFEKQRYLESKGLRIIRVSWKEFRADPEGVIRRVLQELELRRIEMAV